MCGGDCIGGCEKHQSNAAARVSNKEWRSKCKIAVRIGDLDLLSCDSRLTTEGPQDRLEICQWGEDSRWAIAVIEKNGGDTDLRFISDRPFRVDRSIFWELAEMAYSLINTLHQHGGNTNGN